MWQIILYVWQICLLRVGPEKIPARWNFLAIFFGFYFLISGFSIITSRPDLNLFSGAVTIFIGSGVAASDRVRPVEPQAGNKQVCSNDVSNLRH